MKFTEKSAVTALRVSQIRSLLMVYFVFIPARKQKPIAVFVKSNKVSVLCSPPSLANVCPLETVNNAVIKERSV